MGWNDFYRRRDAINQVIELADRGGDGNLRWERVADAFPDEAALLTALHYKWTKLLTGQTELALNDYDDKVDAVTEAWRSTAAQHPALRRILDAHADNQALQTALVTEQRMLAYAAGLAEPGDSPQDTAKVGHTVLTLIRTAPQAGGRRRTGAFERFRRFASAASA
jgi:hypothetical protein